MNDRFPQNMEFAIDRQLLCRHLRLKWLCAWLTGPGLFGLMLGFLSISDSLDTHDYSGLCELLLTLLFGLGTGSLIGAALGVALYFVFSHRRAAKMAESLKVTVEGPFLHIFQEGLVRTDRKLHFRSIVDYATVEDGLMRRHGIQALCMTTTGGGPQSTVQILGLKDCLKVRDMLAEIDSLREKA